MLYSRLLFGPSSIGVGQLPSGKKPQAPTNELPHRPVRLVSQGQALPQKEKRDSCLGQRLSIGQDESSQSLLQKYPTHIPCRIMLAKCVHTLDTACRSEHKNDKPGTWCYCQASSHVNPQHFVCIVSVLCLVSVDKQRLRLLCCSGTGGPRCPRKPLPVLVGICPCGCQPILYHHNHHIMRSNTRYLPLLVEVCRPPNKASFGNGIRILKSIASGPHRFLAIGLAFNRCLHPLNRNLSRSRGDLQSVISLRVQRTQ